MTDLNEQLCAEFEAWARKENYSLEWDDEGHYATGDTMSAWDGFKAARRTPASPAVQPVGDERAMFEAWLTDFFLKVYAYPPTFAKDDGSGDHYADASVSNAWTAWQARAALSPATVQAAPAGYVILPMLANDAMLEAIEDEAIAETAVEWDSDLGSNITFGDASKVYASLIAAAPALHAAAGADAKDALLAEIDRRIKVQSSVGSHEAAEAENELDDLRDFVVKLYDRAAIASSAEEVKHG